MRIFFQLALLVSFYVSLNVGACAVPQHGYSIYGTLKYGSDFKFFDYVNPLAPKGGHFNIAALGTFDSLNPFIVKGISAAGLSMLYPSLGYATLMLDSKDEIGSSYGYIAETIEVDPEYKWVIFQLRKEATFSDNSPITAADVNYSFTQLVQKGHPLYKAYYENVASVEILGSRKIRFNFSVSNRELPGILGQFPILSKAFYEKHGFEKADLTLPVTSGPYVIKEVKPGSLITFERRPNFWGEDLPINKGCNNFHTITYRYFKDDRISFEDFKAGNQDMRLETTAKNWVQEYNFPAFKRGEIVKKEFHFKTPAPFQGLIFNLRRSLFQDVKVRQALTLLYDFEFMNRSFFYDQYQRLNSYFQNSSLSARGLPTPQEIEIMEKYRGKIPPQAFTHEFLLPVNDGSGNIRPHLITARNLLKEAGFILKDKKLIHIKTAQPFQFEIIFTSQALEKLLHSYAANLKKIGIGVRLRFMDTSQYVYRLDNFDFDMILGIIPQSPSPGNEQRDFWLSSRADMPGGRNFAGIKNPVIDDVVESLIQAPTREELTVYTRVLDRLLLWNFYMIPLYTSGATRLAVKKTVGMPAVVPDYGLEMDSWWFQPS